MGALKSSDHGRPAVPVCLSEERFREGISDEEFSLFAELIYTVAGIRLTQNKKGLLVSRLSRRLKQCGCSGFRDYFERVRSDEGELIQMLNSVSTNTTNFFREKYHFEYLRKTILPDLLGRKTVRIWSAGCSTGEEPYSVAVTVHEALHESGVESRSRDIRILATDISTRVLETAQAGIYEREQIPDDIPREVVERYFLRGTGEHAGRIRAKDFLREMIRFRRLNLKEGAYPFKHPFDIIFCRNVMIYFDDGMKRHVLSKFHVHLADEGHLFLGHSETMFDKEQFVPVFITVYRKN
ncbi:MAG: protein-glutamate O-methyltransferase CheR [Nitrospirota bacterium]